MADRLGRRSLNGFVREPSATAYYLPAGLLVIGIVILVLTPGHTSPLIGFGLVLVSGAPSLAMMIALRRGTNKIDS